MAGVSQSRQLVCRLLYAKWEARRECRRAQKITVDISQQIAEMKKAARRHDAELVADTRLKRRIEAKIIKQTQQS